MTVSRAGLGGGRRGTLGTKLKEVLPLRVLQVVLMRRGRHLVPELLRERDPLRLKELR